MEKTNFELLHDYAKSSNRVIKMIESPYPEPNVVIHKFVKFKRTAYTPISDLNKGYLAWFYDYHKPISEEATYSGAFIPISIAKDVSIHIRSKTVLHKLQLFGNSKYIKTGSSSFDSKVLITTNNTQAAKKLLSKTRLQKIILKALALDPAMCISINEKDLEYIPSLENKSYISILRPRHWYVEKKEIDALLSLGQSFENYYYESLM